MLSNRTCLTFLLICLKILSRNASDSYLRDTQDVLFETEPLRYLVFGTSISYGNGLVDKEKGYPYLLSSDVTNLARPSSDATYPGICAQTLIKDNIFDVIIIEYDVFNHFKLPLLVQRIRSRFPDATIILTCMWYLRDVQVKTKDGDITLISWLKRQSWYSKRDRETTLTEILQNSSNFESEDEFFLPLKLLHKEIFVRKVAMKYDAYVYSWDHEQSPLTNLPLFVDLVHINEKGHSLIAEGLKEILATVNPERSNKIGTWGSGDFCTSWHRGHIDNFAEGRIPIHSPIFDIELFNEKKAAHAFQLKDKETLVIIDSPLKTPHKLYLQFFATAPKRIYPRISARVNSANATIIDPMVISDTPVHVHDIKYAGVVHYGMNELKLKVLDKTETPFRFTGFAITNEVFSNNKQRGAPMIW